MVASWPKPCRMLEELTSSELNPVEDFPRPLPWGPARPTVRTASVATRATTKIAGLYAAQLGTPAEMMPRPAVASAGGWHRRPVLRVFPPIIDSGNLPSPLTEDRVRALGRSEGASVAQLTRPQQRRITARRKRPLGHNQSPTLAPSIRGLCNSRNAHFLGAIVIFAGIGPRRTITAGPREIRRPNGPEAC